VKRRLVLLVFAAGWLAGCGSTTYRPLNPPNNQEAIVVIIRQRAEPTAWNLYVAATFSPSTSLPNNSHARFSLPAGRHTIRFFWPRLAAGVNLEKALEFKGTETRYLLVSGSSRMTGTSPAYQGVTLHFAETLRFVELPPSAGEQLLRDMQSEK
jgi:hypothetical protein